MPWGFALGAAGAIGSALISSSASSSAADAQQTAANNSTAELARQFDKTQANMAPWLTAGSGALSKLAGLYGISSTPPATGTAASGAAATTGTATGSAPAGSTFDPSSTFWQSPDYQFAMQQGINGVDAGASQTGSLDSGATRKAEIAYAGNLASSQYNAYANRLAALAGVGQTAASDLGTAGQNYANNYSGIIQNAANNQASSYAANGQAMSNSLSELVGMGQGLITRLNGGGTFNTPQTYPW